MRGAMKFLSKILILGLIVMALLIPMVTADPLPGTVTYGGAQRTATISNFFGVSLGIENIPGIALDTAIAYYNWISLGLIFLLGAMSSKRMTRFFSILIPVFAALLVYIGWMHSPNPATTWSIIIVCGLLGVITYMKGSLKENFGGSGAGNLLLNIVFYIIILQVCVGVINATGLWTQGGGGNILDNTSTDQTYALNADLTKSVPAMSQTGGLYNTVKSAATMASQIIWGCAMMLVSIIESLAVFSVVLLQMYPWITAPDGGGTLGVLFLGALQLGIYFVYTMYFITLFGNKPLENTAF